MYRNLCMIAVLRLTTSKIYYRFISFPLRMLQYGTSSCFFYDNILLLCYAKIHSLAAGNLHKTGTAFVTLGEN